MNEQKGFTLVEGLVVVLLLGLVGAGGWYVYRHNKPETTNTSNSTQVKQPQTSLSKDDTASWSTYTSADKSYSIKLPDGWKLESHEGTGGPYTKKITDLAYVKGVKATVSPTNFAGDIPYASFAMGYGETGFGFNLRGDKVGTIKADSGLEISKYRFVMNDEPMFMDYPKGTVHYDYRVVVGTKTFQAVHDVLAGEQDQTALIEKALKSLVISK